MPEIRSETARAAAPGGVAASGPRPGLALPVLAAAQLMVVLECTFRSDKSRSCSTQC
jgi:hypothetical protein